jgi:hypothetical protein
VVEPVGWVEGPESPIAGLADLGLQRPGKLEGERLAEEVQKIGAGHQNSDRSAKAVTGI